MELTINNPAKNDSAYSSIIIVSDLVSHVTYNHDVLLDFSVCACLLRLFI
jgi:hypothetical protein